MQHGMHRQPIVAVLREQGRNQAWLARKVGYNRSYLNQVFHGHEPASAAVRRLCADELGLPESELFHADEDAGAGADGQSAVLPSRTANLNGKGGDD